MNTYDPATHGVCGYPRPVLARASYADLQNDRGRCACGLEVRLVEGEWTHYVEGETTVRVGALPPTVDELAEKITMARQAHELYLEDLRRLVDEVIDLSGTDSVIELVAELERGQDVTRHLDDLAVAVADAAR